MPPQATTKAQDESCAIEWDIQYMPLNQHARVDNGLTLWQAIKATLKMAITGRAYEGEK